MDSFGALKLTDKCRSLLRGEEQIELRKDNAEQLKKTKTAKVDIEVAAEDQALWQALRALRKQLVDENEVPPFVVFHDRTLKDMIALKPLSNEQFLTISGVGASKLTKYGDAFLTLIAEHLR